jgi:hypothetical protein
MSNRERAAATLVDLAKVFSAVDRERVVRLSDTVEHFFLYTGDPVHNAKVLAELIRPVSVTDPDRAGHLAARAEKAARSATSRAGQVDALGDLVRALAVTDPARALSIAVEAAQIAQSVTTLDLQVTLNADLAEALAAVDTGVALELAGHAERMALLCDAPIPRGTALTAVVRALSVLDDDGTGRVAALAAHTIRTVPNHDERASQLAELVRTLVEAGQWQLAADFAEQVVASEHRARALAYVAAGAAGLAGTGAVDADALAGAALPAALEIADPVARSEITAVLADVFAEAQRWERAEEAAAAVADPAEQASAWAALVRHLVDAVDPDADARMLRAVAHSMVGADPTRSLAALAKVHPELALEVCEAVLPLFLSATRIAGD